MSRKVHLHLFLLCGILWHIIVMISSEENIRRSSDLLLRKKRVLNQESGADVPVRIIDFPYVVHIKKSNRINCVGSILSRHTVITAAACVALNIEVYKVSSGVIRTTNGKMHNIIRKETHFSSTLPRAALRDGVALITVDPPFVYSPFTFKIDLHVGIILPNTLGIVAGWGHQYRTESGTNYNDKLRAINVPIISHRECVNMYRNMANITEKEICTFHRNKFCGVTDVGAALVINNTLAGIHLWGGQIAFNNMPDVFLLVQDLEYSNWIRTNIL